MLIFGAVSVKCHDPHARNDTPLGRIILTTKVYRCHRDPRFAHTSAEALAIYTYLYQEQTSHPHSLTVTYDLPSRHIGSPKFRRVSELTGTTVPRQIINKTMTYYAEVKFSFCTLVLRNIQRHVYVIHVSHTNMLGTLQWIALLILLIF